MHARADPDTLICLHSDIVKLGHHEEHREALRAAGIRTSSGGVAAVAKAGGVFSEFGTNAGGGVGADSAYADLMAKAAELRKNDPKLTTAQAFAKVYEDPENRPLVLKHKQQDANKLAKMAATIHG